MLRRISPLTWLLIAIGVVFVIVAVVYLTTTVPNLPSFWPGYVKHVRHARKYTKRGIAAILVAVVAFGAAYYNEMRHA